MPETLPPQSLYPEAARWIIDVREPDEFWQEHIPGSRNIPLAKIAHEVEGLKAQERLILSCRSGARASRACETLAQLGLSPLALLEGGIEGWKRAGHPTVRQRRGFSVMQQVQLTVGTMVLVGTFVPGYWPLAALAGVGLLTAGLTNTCMLATLLGKLPWNQTQAKACSLSASGRTN